MENTKKKNLLSVDEREELEFYRTFIKSMNGSMYIMNQSPYYLEWISDNANVERTTGLTAQKILEIGEEIPSWLLDSPDFEESVTIPLERFQQSPNLKWAGVYRIRHLDGSLKWTMYSAATFAKNEEGLPTKCAMMAFPLVDIFNTPETLKELQQYLSQQMYKETILSLTERQLDVLKLLASGDSTKEIAAKLNISPYTVGDHKKALLDKLDCKSTSELATLAQKMGVV